MPTVKREQLEAMRRRLERLRFERTPGLGFSDAEFDLMVLADVSDDLMASCREASRLLAAMADSKKIAFTDEQRRVLKEHYGRAVLAITNAGGQP